MGRGREHQGTTMLESIELETAPNPTASVIWLHGLGADGNDFAPIVPELELPERAIRFVFPHAPMQPVTINGGMVMRAWYDIDLSNPTVGERDIGESAEAIERIEGRDAETNFCDINELIDSSGVR